MRACGTSSLHGVYEPLRFHYARQPTHRASSTAVTAIVGVAAPIGTVLVTNSHDDNRLHAERVQADRAELRKVLGDAVRAVDMVGGRYGELNSRITLRTGSRRGRRPAVASVTLLSMVIAINRLNERLAQNYVRVAIRLGRESQAGKRMVSARDTGSQVTSALLDFARNKPSNERLIIRRSQKVIPLLRRYDYQAKSFTDAAYRVARSTTD